jgi:hypothetical protein
MPAPAIPARSRAAAAAGSSIAVSGEKAHRVIATASVGGFDGPRITAMSTTDRLKASTAKTGSRISG